MLFYLDNWLSADPNAISGRTTCARGRRATRRGANQPRRRPQRRAASRAGSTRTTRASCSSCTRSASTAATPSRMSSSRARVHRLDDRPARRSRASGSRRRMHDRGAKKVLGQTIKRAAASRTASACSTSSRGIRRPRGTSPSSWRSGSSATRRRRRWSIARRRTFTETDGDLREVVRAIVTSPEFFAPDALSRQGEDAVRVRRQRAARDRRRRSRQPRRSCARSPSWACRSTCASRRPATTRPPTPGSRPARSSTA